MTDINRQRFLAELGRLLTFMLEEDRLAALAMYNKLFDESSDEQALLVLLVSPTRQAVLIARAYNAASGTPVEEDAERQSEYVRVIDTIRAEALNRGLLREEDRSADQISIFDEAEPVAEKSSDNTGNAPEEPGDAQTVADASAETPVEQSEPEKDETQSEHEKDEKPGLALRFDEEGNLVFEDVAEEPEKETDSESKAASTDEAQTPAAPQPAAEEPTEELPAIEPPAAVEAPVVPEPPAEPELFSSAEELDAPAEPVKKAPAPHEATEPERRPIVWALILYVILAVPLTLIGLVILLVPTFGSLALSGLFGVVGAIAVSAAFGGSFAVFANVLVVLGVALMLLALSLLFLWLFVWFIVGVMVSLVSGAIALGRKWCYKEVQSE